MAHKLIDKYFSKDDLKKISEAITENEKKTSGEIRVSVHEKRPFLMKKKSIRDLAVKEFHSLKMYKTIDKTGILIFLLLGEKSFYILADAGINEKVKQETWDNVRNKMQEAFKKGIFRDGIIAAINEMGDILGAHFPIKPDDTNELSNEVVVK